MKVRVLGSLCLIVLTSVCGWAQDKSTPKPDTASYTVTGLVLDGSNDPGQSASDIQTLSNDIINTGVKWVMLSTLWLYSEPNAPTSSCQPSQGPNCYCGPKAACHNYNFTTLDKYVNNLTAAGINVAIRFYIHPSWAGGNPCQGFCPGGGQILSNHMTTFSNNLYDLAYNMATRYKGKVNMWAVWNEPDLGGFFSPQDLNAGGGYNTNEYMVLIQFPGSNAIRSVIPGATMIGPELYTPVGGGDENQCDDFGHCGTVYEWEAVMLDDFSGNFPVFSIHNYSNNPSGQLNAVQHMVNIEQTYGKTPPIWVTEFNYVGGTCSYSQNTLVSYLSTYYHSTIARSFYYALPDGGGQSCGYGLVMNKSYGWAQKVPLYSGYSNIVHSLP